LHRRSTLQPRLPISLRLASGASLRLYLPTSTSNPSSTVRSFSKSSGPFSSLRLQPTVQPNLPAGLRLASTANLPVPLSSRPATVAACRTSSHALQSPSSLRLPPIFRLNLPANLFDLRLLVNLPALLPNLTSDSRRRRICWRCPQIDRRPSPLINRPALPADQPPTLIVCCIPSALPSCSSSTCVSDFPSGAACGASSASPAAESLRRCPPANRRLASPTNLPALPDEPNFRIPGRCVFRLLSV